MIFVPAAKFYVLKCESFKAGAGPSRDLFRDCEPLFEALFYNKVSTRDYVGRLAQAMGTTPEKIEAAPEPSFILGLKRFAWDSLWIPLSRRGTYNILV